MYILMTWLHNSALALTLSFLLLPHPKHGTHIYIFMLRIHEECWCENQAKPFVTIEIEPNRMKKNGQKSIRKCVLLAPFTKTNMRQTHTHTQRISFRNILALLLHQYIPLPPLKMWAFYVVALVRTKEIFMC